ncbi:MAG: TraR/DksA family transcriptional regulator [Planctomycetota bacterium]
MNNFKKLLLEKRMEILSDVAKIENESLKKSRLDATGDLSNVPIHMADIGTDNFEQEFALDLMDGERKLLDEIHRALERIEDGTYGICEGTGKQIPKARLKAQPWARYCVEYARKVEQGLVP